MHTIGYIFGQDKINEPFQNLYRAILEALLVVLRINYYVILLPIIIKY